MSEDVPGPSLSADCEQVKSRAPRADSQRNLRALLEAALALFRTSGVDAPVREIADKAGVGVGTLYRHFPQRADLVIAVFRKEIDACADAAPELAKAHSPGEALELWLQRYLDFINTKRGLATALHSGNPAYGQLPAYFPKRLLPALQGLLEAAAQAGEARADVDAGDLLEAVASLARLTSGDDTTQARRMVSLLVDGLKFGAAGRTSP